MTPPDPWPAVAERLEALAKSYFDFAEEPGKDAMLRHAADLRTALTRITDQAAEIEALRARAEAAERRVGVLSEAVKEFLSAQSRYESLRSTSVGERVEQAADRLFDADQRLRSLASGSADRGGEG